MEIRSVFLAVFYFREQRAKRACLHAHLTIAAESLTYLYYTDFSILFFVFGFLGAK